LPFLKWRDLGDLHRVMALMKNKVPMMEMDSCLSVFADTGDNLCLSHGATKEFTETLAMPAGWGRALKPV